MDVDVVNDIYANLESNEPDLDLEVEKLQQQNSDLQLHIESLECDVEKLCSKIMDMKKTQDNLAKNISELFKTAKAEIERKDRIISDLRSQLDGYISQTRVITVPSKRSRENTISKSDIDSSTKKIKRDNENQARKHNSSSQKNRSRSRSRDRYKSHYKERSRDQSKKEIKSGKLDKHKPNKETSLIRVDCNKTNKSTIKVECEANVKNQKENMQSVSCKTNDKMPIKTDEILSEMVQDAYVRIVKNNATEEVMDSNNLEIKSCSIITCKRNDDIKEAKLEKSCVKVALKEITKENKRVEKNILEFTEKQIVKENIVANKHDSTDSVKKYKTNKPKIEEVTSKLLKRQEVGLVSTSTALPDQDVKVGTESESDKQSIKNEKNLSSVISVEGSFIDKLNDKTVNNLTLDVNCEKTNLILNIENFEKSTQSNKIKKCINEKLSSPDGSGDDKKKGIQISNDSKLKKHRESLTDKEYKHEKNTNKIDEDKPESDRVLRSSTRRHSVRENIEKNKDRTVDNQENQKNENMEHESLCKSQLTPHILSPNFVSIGLTHEGDIPVLHIADTNNSENDRNKSLFVDYGLTVTSSSPSTKNSTIEDLKILSLNENNVENENKTSSEINISQRSEANLSIKLSSDSSTVTKSLLDGQKTVSGASSGRKRRRVIFTMID
ncbi:glutamic acid-rich protein-like [Tenebrio molitor]|uniref:glutamic acid-rich protein-like n=1 Tax=Tenebrio molitor TaxID=7067 RepID=UPI0036247110